MKGSYVRAVAKQARLRGTGSNRQGALHGMCALLQKLSHGGFRGPARESEDRPPRPLRRLLEMRFGLPAKRLVHADDGDMVRLKCYQNSIRMRTGTAEPSKSTAPTSTAPAQSLKKPRKKTAASSRRCRTSYMPSRANARRRRDVDRSPGKSNPKVTFGGIRLCGPDGCPMLGLVNGDGPSLLLSSSF